MAKQKTIYTCQSCGYETPKWSGRCNGCGEWNSFVEEEKVEKKPNVRATSLSKSTPLKLKEVNLTTEERIFTGSKELDQVLGGGLVKGSLVLVGGDPGIGKSTLLLQICEAIGKQYKILYASGEESVKQIKMRAQRLAVTTENLLLLSETDLDAIKQGVFDECPDLLIVDSVQTVYKGELTSAPGSVSQVREVTLDLMRIAKESGLAVMLVGHVTKEGTLAGPRVLEHMVDCVLYFEGERHQSYRILRAVKNRFGSTNEIGVFEMQETGLVEVANPSQMLLAGRPQHVSGSAVVCVLEGTRPMLSEVQALISPTVFGNARRMATGLDYNRICMIMAVLEKRVGLSLSSQDAHINVVGGLKIDEPAADLGVAVAIASNYRDFVLSPKTLLIGEVGLTGEVRSVSYLEKRLNEAVKLGFEQALIPYENSKKLKPVSGMEIHGVKTVGEALKLLGSVKKK